MDLLPSDVIYLIGSYLSFTDISRLSRVNTKNFIIKQNDHFDPGICTT